MAITRLFVDDPTRKDQRALISTAKLARMTDIVAPTPQYMAAVGDDQIAVQAGCAVTIDSGAFFYVDSDMTIGAANLDTGGAFAKGNDYYVYVVDTGDITQDGRLVISLNSTYPNGSSALSSRKIGGFHFGVCRRVNTAMQPVNTSGAERGSGWESNVYNGILPRSVWTLKHRPKCQPEGMVYIGGGVWLDIYECSDDGAGGVLSKYNATPLSGTEGLHWYSFVEKLLVSGKRLPSYDEWCAGALGSPQGQDGNNTNAYAATSNTARGLTGSVVNAVSSFGLVDCAGRLWEWIKDLIHDPTGTTGAYHDVMPGYGRLYMYNATGLHALIAGGSWANGADAGARAAHCNNRAWYVSASLGARGACDSL